MFMARSGGIDKAFSFSGTGKFCKFPMGTATGVPTQALVYAGGVPVVVAGDPVAPHPIRGCGPDVSPAIPSTVKVFVTGRPAIRIFDWYGSDNIILSGFPLVAVF